MNYVEPIRDPNTIYNICEYLKNTNIRNYMLFLTGIYTGLRISDILSLRIKDVKDKTCIRLREQKTGKEKMIEINSVLKKAIKEYCIDKKDEEFLIRSSRRMNKAISRVMGYKILKAIGKEFNLECLGTHTMRKTFGYHFYKQTKDVVLLQKIFNHSDPSITLHYIGIEQENINSVMRKFKI